MKKLIYSPKYFHNLFENFFKKINIIILFYFFIVGKLSDFDKLYNKKLILYY